MVTRVDPPSVYHLGLVGLRDPDSGTMTTGISATPKVDFLIVGMARSGTTVLQRMASEFASVWVPPETHFWRHAATLSTRYPWPLDKSGAEDALTWLASTEAIESLPFDEMRALDALDDKIYLWDLFHAVVVGLSPPEALILGEKTPDHLLWAEQLLNEVPSLKVVCLIRDPREVLRSHRTVPWGISDPAVFAEKWVYLAERIDDCRRLFPDRVLALRYEDAVTSAENTRTLLASFLDIEDNINESVDRRELLFPDSEWWKERSLSPVERIADTWQQSLSDTDISSLEHRCSDTMEKWGYAPISKQKNGASSTTAAWEMRRSLRRISNLVLPVSAAVTEEWSRSDLARMERWRIRAEELQSERRSLDEKLRQETAVRAGLEGWRSQAVELQQLVTHLRETNEQSVRRLEAAEHELQAAEREARAWKTRSHEMQVARENADLLRLRAERRYRLTAGKLNRLRARRWWKLAGVLSRWRKRPWRIWTLSREAWTTVLEPSQLPEAPDLGRLDKRIARIEQMPAKPPEEGIEAAKRAFDAGEYDKALELLEETPHEVQTSREALMLANGCYVRMGELTAGLQTIRRLLRHVSDPHLHWQERFQTGRLTETDPRWLPDVGASRPVNPPTPRPGVVFHILKESLPYFERGYTMRSHTTLLSQQLAGFDPVVVTSLGFPRSQGFDSFASREDLDGIPHHRLDLGPSYPLKEAPFDQLLSDQATLTAQLAKELRPALVQAGSGYRGYETALVGLAVARYLDIPMVYEIRSFLEQTWTGELEWAEKGEYYHRRYEQEVRCLNEADHVITIAESMRNEIIGRGITPDKVSVVPNVVDIERFTPRPKSRALMNEYEIEGASTIGYISNLGFREGIENLVHGVAYLRKAGLNVKGLVVGDGPQREKLQSLVERLDLTEHVVLTGHVPNTDIEEHYALIDLFVIPRIDDRAARLVTPLKPLEAMAMNIPVIAADLPALRELVMPGDRGEVFRPSDPAHLAEVAGKLLVDEATRMRYAAAGREWVVTDRTLDANAQRYREILDPILGREP